MSEEKFLIKNDFVPKSQAKPAPIVIKSGFFSRNQAVSYAIAIACVLFIVIFSVEKSKSFLNLIPILRGEVGLPDELVITSIDKKYPILIKKYDPFIANQLRFSGNVNSLFSETALAICEPDDTVLEIGSHFGFNSIMLGKKLAGHGKLYAYEPNPKIYNCLRKNIILNDLEDTVIPKNIAISNHSGTCNIDDTFSMQDKNGEIIKAGTIEMQCNTLEQECMGMHPDLLLIDIPYQDVEILNSAKNFIDDSPGVKILISIESNGKEKQSVFDMFDFLISKNFKAYQAQPGGILTKLNKEQILTLTNGVVLFTQQEVR